MLGCKECCFEIRIDEIEDDDYMLILDGLCGMCTKIYWELEEMKW
jgi:hypothetical protein